MPLCFLKGIGMLIRKIEEVSKAKCKIMFDDLQSIVLYKTDLRRYNLSNGVEVSVQQMNVFLEEVLPGRAKMRCMKLLQSRDYTECELAGKLRKDGYPESVVEAAVSYVKSYGYLDDERYVKDYIRFKSVKKSRKQMQLDLQQKGISKELVQRIFAENQCYEGIGGDCFCIRKLLYKKKYVDVVWTFEEKEKIKAYLFRKGFELKDISVCMKDFDYSICENISSPN